MLPCLSVTFAQTTLINMQDIPFMPVFFAVTAGQCFFIGLSALDIHDLYIVPYPTKNASTILYYF